VKTVIKIKKNERKKRNKKKCKKGHLDIRRGEYYNMSGRKGVYWGE